MSVCLSVCMYYVTEVRKQAKGFITLTHKCIHTKHAVIKFTYSGTCNVIFQYYVALLGK